MQVTSQLMLTPHKVGQAVVQVTSHDAVVLLQSVVQPPGPWQSTLHTAPVALQSVVQAPPPQVMSQRELAEHTL